MSTQISRRQALAITASAAGVALVTPRIARARPGIHAWRDAGLELGNAGEFTLPALPYPFSALEPSIDAETMEIHHDRHHKAYVDNANKALAGTRFTELTSEKILASLDDVPDDKKAAVRNNVGGHVNHSMFWLMMAPAGTGAGKGGGGEPTGALADAIKATFGSFGDKGGFKDQFAEAATKRFGSGWAWLISRDGKLAIASTANQDCPLMPEKYAGATGTPILGLDVWEHAYYLKYRNKRADYITAWWNVVNWTKVAQLHTATMGGAEISK